MKVFVAGATGYIGAAVTRALLARGHSVLGGARSEASAAKVRALGAEPFSVDLTDAATFEAGARLADAVVQAASSHDATSSDTEPKAADAVLTALAGTGRPFVLTSGIWIYGATGHEPAIEATKVNPIPLTAWRVPVEQAVLGAEGVRGIVIRPGIVYGNDGGGLERIFVDQGERDGKILLPGGGANRWPAVHVDDLADLYVLAVERADATGIFNGTTDETITLGEVGAAVSKRLRGIPVVAWPIAEARKTLGIFADALALDQVVRSPRSQEVLGWLPKRLSFADDLARGARS